MIAIDNDRRSKNKNGRYTLNSYRIFLFNSATTTPELKKIRRTKEKLWSSWLRWRDIT